MDKELLLKDLSSRLPYRPILNWKFLDNTSRDEELKELSDLDIWWITKAQDCEVRPYLRPMESMTEEEIEELKTLCSIHIPTDSPTIAFEEYGILVFTHHLTNNTYSFRLNLDVIDWFNKNMFDYRGLIPMGLALEAPKGMYK